VSFDDNLFFPYGSWRIRHFPPNKERRDEEYGTKGKNINNSK